MLGSGDITVLKIGIILSLHLESSRETVNMQVNMMNGLKKVLGAMRVENAGDIY